MPITAKKVLRAIRGIPKPEVRRSALEDLVAKQVGQESKMQLAEGQNAIVARREFDARMREIDEIRKIEEQRAYFEQQRQYAINQKRIKNLKKARKAKIMRKRGAR